jgi:hypothetical protein
MAGPSAQVLDEEISRGKQSGQDQARCMGSNPCLALCLALSQATYPHRNMYASKDGHLYATKDAKDAADARYLASFSDYITLEPCHANGTAAVQASLIDRSGI